MKLIINDLKNMKWYQWTFIIIVSIFLTITSIIDLNEFINFNKLTWVWTDKPAWKGTLGVMSGIAAFTGIICVIQVARGKLSNYIWGFINVSIYGLYAFSVAYTGDAFLNLCFFLPMQVIGFITWKKNLQKAVVINNIMTWYKFLFFAVLLGVLWVIFYYLIPVLDNSLNTTLKIVGYEGYPFSGPTIPHLLDSFTNAASITAQILMLKRFKEQWCLWICVNAAQLTMYAGINGYGVNPPMLIMWSVFLLNSIYGFALWYQRERKLKLKIEKFLGFSVKKIVPLKGGYSSNENYLVDNHIHVHFATNKINHTNEFKAYALYGHKIFKKTNNGNIAKEFIVGQNPDFSNSEHLIAVIKEIKKLHKSDSKEFDKHGINTYLKSTSIDKTLLKEFKSMKKEYNSEPFVLIHGDINQTNVVINNNKATLIDFEWVRSGPAIIDYASILAFSGANIDEVVKITKIKKVKLIRFTRMVLIHTLMWCESQKTGDSKRLEKIVMKQLKIYV